MLVFNPFSIINIESTHNKTLEQISQETYNWEKEKKRKEKKK